jgi:uncharacterized protein (TIGR03089 family)
VRWGGSKQGARGLGAVVSHRGKMGAMSIPAAELMTILRSGHSTSPRLTWYGPDSERVELSGRVLDNWVAKTSNLLQDELDAVPGTRMRVDLPPHWKSIVLALGAWQLGMEIALDTGTADLLATAEPDSVAASAGYDAIIAVPLAALAMQWPGELAAGVLDYAAEVRSHGDVFMPHVDPDSSRLAIRTAEGTGFRHSDLLAGFAAGHENGARLLVRGDAGLEEALRQSLGAWQQEGSVVLVHPDVKVTDKLLADERVQGN